jgi:hypothetical protein
MARLFDANDTINAGKMASRSVDFYNVNLYQFFAPKSVRNESKDIPLNDFIAMGIANTAMDRPYTEMVKGDFTVEFKPLTSATAEGTFTRPTGLNLRTINFEGVGTSTTNRVVGRRIVPNQINPATGSEVEGNLRVARVPGNLNQMVNQRNMTVGATTTTVPAAGALTSETFLAEHAVAGTNRRLVQFAFRAFLCRDIKEWRDGDERIADNQVTKDVPRSPGGDPLAYHNECRTCHQVMDPLRKAFSGFDYSGTAVSYTSDAAGKLLTQNDDNLPPTQSPRNPFGAFMRDNGGFQDWENKAIYGTNAKYFGWSGALTGRGVTSFGTMMSLSKAFKTCAVTQVWDQICSTSLQGSEGDKIKDRLGDAFEGDNYNLKNLYVKVALEAECNGGLYVASGGSSTGASGSGGSGTTPAPTPASGVVPFNIAAGTGNGAWNTETNPVIVRMGGQATVTVRITNQDSTPKVLHSNGGNFCPHGDTVNQLQTGQSYDCVIKAGAVGSTTCPTGAAPIMYNHNVGTSAKFCIQVVQ